MQDLDGRAPGMDLTESRTRQHGPRLLTHFGTLVCWDEAAGEMVHRPLEEIDADPRLSCIVLSDALPVVVRDDRRTLVGENQGELTHEVVCHAASRGRLIYLSQGDSYFCAEADGSISKRGAAGGWETFRPVDNEELALWQGICAGRWLARSAGDLVEPGAMMLGQDFHLRFGRYEIDVAGPISADLKPGAHRTAPSEFVAVHDSWKIEQFKRVRPLVYYVAYGNDRPFLMMQKSIQSLIELGGYEGDILVITDRDEAGVGPFMPDRLRGSWHVHNIAASGFVEFCRSRYQVASWPGADGYQPLLYVDTDVLFDAPVEPILLKIVRSDKLCAQRERDRPLATADSVGATLFAEDSCFVGSQRGFNSGIIGIPNLRDHRTVLQLTAEVIDRYAAACGAQALGWFDQAIVNYVAYKLADIDLTILDQHIRWGGRNAFHGGSSPLGLVHLWGAKDKLAEMTELFDIVAGRTPGTLVKWSVYR